LFFFQAGEVKAAPVNFGFLPDFRSGGRSSLACFTSEGLLVTDNIDL
jgi:hypothetical protein